MPLTRKEFLRLTLGIGAAAVGVAALGPGCAPAGPQDGDAGRDRPDDAGGHDAGDHGGNDAGDHDAGGHDAGDHGGHDAGTTAETCADGARHTAITGNHGHSLTIPAADVEAGVEKTYSIEGGASHPHDVTISAAQFATLADGGTFTVTSTSTGHTHSVTVACA